MKKLVAGLLLASSAFSVAALAQGSGIPLVQKRLVELGYKPGNTDGAWDPRTRNAIAFFQRRNGVSNANGYITNETLILLGLKQAAPSAVEESAPTAPVEPVYIAGPEAVPVYIPEPSAPAESVFEPAPAQKIADTEPKLQERTLVTGVARIGFVFGGDNAFNTGATNDSDVDYGGLVDAALGLNVRLRELPISIQLTGGYRIEEDDRDNGKARVSAIPVNLTAFYNFDKVRLGLGAVGHFDPTQYFEVAGTTRQDRTLKDAFGAALEVAYAPVDGSTFMIGLRYEGIEYEIRGQTDKVDASTTGAFVGFRF
jgi:peptidoglycan hydrolase-like protein with peptidoglycan-binding domain